MKSKKEAEQEFKPLKITHGRFRSCARMTHKNMYVYRTAQQGLKFFGVEKFGRVKKCVIK